jgi:hypothetical protein
MWESKWRALHSHCFGRTCIKSQQLLSITQGTKMNEEAIKCTLQMRPESSQCSATAPKKGNYLVVQQLRDAFVTCNWPCFTPHSLFSYIQNVCLTYCTLFVNNKSWMNFLLTKRRYIYGLGLILIPQHTPNSIKCRLLSNNSLGVY